MAHDWDALRITATKVWATGLGGSTEYLRGQFALLLGGKTLVSGGPLRTRTPLSFIPILSNTFPGTSRQNEPFVTTAIPLPTNLFSLLLFQFTNVSPAYQTPTQGSGLGR